MGPPNLPVMTAEVPFPGSDRPPLTVGGGVRSAVTAAIVLVPFAGLAVAVWLAWGHGLGLSDALLALAFYVLTGLGISVGFHRLLTHRSFTAARPLRIALAVAGSMSFEGDVIGWVAIHRRHHAFTDRPGDPHSPYRYGTSLAGQLRGLAHAHAGWLLRDDPSPPARYAPDLLADPAMRMISRGFPVLSAVSLALPFAAGWVIGGTWHAALAALLWAGLVRVAAAAARHLERQLAVPCLRHPALRHAPPRPGHQPVAARPGVVRRELAQHAPLRPRLRAARRRAGAGGHLRRPDPDFRAPGLGHRRALA